MSGERELVTVPADDSSITRTCTVTGIPAGSFVDAFLVPSSYVTVAEDGTVTFRDSEDSNNLADEVGSFDPDGAGAAPAGPAIGARIVNVNGTNVTPSARVNDTNAAIGAISVTIASNSGLLNYGTGDVTLVVNTDPSTTATPAGNNRLNLAVPTAANADSKAPTEAFGIGCDTVFIPAEAPSGQEPNGDIVFLDLERNLIVLDDGFSYYYDSNDDFFYDHNQNLTEEEWEAYLSIGDYIDTDSGTYARTDAAVSDFNNHDDTANAPTGVAATAGDFDLAPADTDADDIRVTFNPSTGGLIDDYTAELYEDDANAATACSAGAFVDSETAASSPIVFTDVDDDTYCVVVYADTVSGGDSPYSAPAVVTVDAVANDEVAPTVTDTRVTTDAGTAGVLDVTDVVRMDFSESLEAAGLDGMSATIAVTDPQGETFTVTGNVVLSDNDAVVNVPAETDRATFTVTSVLKTGGVGDGVANLPSTITAFSGEFEDAAGNVVTTTGSTDVVIDVEL